MGYFIVIGVLAALLAAALIFIAVKFGHEKKEATLTDMELKALAGCYLSLHLIDLKKDTFEPVRDYSVLNEIVQEYREQANFQMKVIMKNLVLARDLEEVLAFVEFTTLMERMTDKERIYIDFEGRMAGWCRAQFLMLSREKNQVLFAVSQINEDKFRENKLRQMAETDYITGLRNRENGEHAVQLMADNQSPGMFCVFEIDGFRELNERIGYREGDNILKKVAEAVNSVFGENAIKYRRNGASYGIFVPGIHERQDARFLMKRLTELIGELPENLDISAGVAFLKADADIYVDQLYERAEACMLLSRKAPGTMVSYHE